MRRHLTLGLLIFYLSGCCCLKNQAEPLTAPESALGKAVGEALEDPLLTEEGDLPSDWWLLFQDAQLTEFLLTAFAQNPTLQKAHATVLRAKYATNQVRAALFPSLMLGADVSRQKLSETGLIPFNSKSTVGSAPLVAPAGVAGIPVYFTQYETELMLTYNFDLWGKNRNTLRAALGEYQAKMADEAFIRLQMGISIAQIYYRLQIAYKREALALQLFQNQQQTANLTAQRVQSNLENEIALSTAELNATLAERVLLQVQGEIALLENELHAYLAGDFEEQILPLDVADLPLPAVPLPQDLPLHLVANRPDIAAQLWLIESSKRLVDVAQAGFYPDFNLNALFGYQTLHLEKLFNWPSSYFNIDPALTLPIFQGGRLIANLRTSEVDYDLAILQYNQLVVNAAKEVLSSLVLLRNTKQQKESLSDRLEKQENILNLTQLRLEHHLNSELDYLKAEWNTLIARDELVEVTGEMIQALLSLIKALGGGYHVCD